MVEGKLVKRDYEREIQAGTSSVKVPALAVEIVVTKIIKLSRPTKAQNVEAEAEDAEYGLDPA